MTGVFAERHARGRADCAATRREMPARLKTREKPAASSMPANRPAWSRVRLLERPGPDDRQYLPGAGKQQAADFR
jgi:hypothetical protein